MLLINIVDFETFGIEGWSMLMINQAIMIHEISKSSNVRRWKALATFFICIEDDKIMLRSLCPTWVKSNLNYGQLSFASRFLNVSFTYVCIKLKSSRKWSTKDSL